MSLSFDLAPMGGPDYSTPRGLGAFVFAIQPEAFGERSTFDAGMTRYLDVLRNSPAREDCRVLAPGDREWTVAAERDASGVTLDPATRTAFEALAGRYGAQLPDRETPAHSKTDGT